MRDTHSLGIQPGRGNVPPFWIQQGGLAGSDVHPDVREEARQLWPWAYRYVESTLGDQPRTAELLEEVVLAVSQRLQVQPEVGRNLKGYLIAAFHHRVGLELIKNGRITFEGLLRDLERKHFLLVPKWLVPVEVKICAGEIVALMPQEARRVAHYRLLDFTWNEIADAMGIQVSQARNRYYYGIKTAWEKLQESAAKRGRSGE